MNGEIGFVPGSQTATIDEDNSRTGMQKNNSLLLFYSATTLTKATQANSLQIDE